MESLDELKEIKWNEFAGNFVGIGEMSAYLYTHLNLPEDYKCDDMTLEDKYIYDCLINFKSLFKCGTADENTMAVMNYILYKFGEMRDSKGSR